MFYRPKRSLIHCLKIIGRLIDNEKSFSCSVRLFCLFYCFLSPPLLPPNLSLCSPLPPKKCCICRKILVSRNMNYSTLLCIGTAHNCTFLPLSYIIYISSLPHPVRHMWEAFPAAAPPPGPRAHPQRPATFLLLDLWKELQRGGPAHRARPHPQRGEALPLPPLPRCFSLALQPG